MNRCAAGTCLLLVLTLLLGACSGAPALIPEAPAGLPSPTPTLAVATSTAPASTPEAAAKLSSPAPALLPTTSPTPTACVETSPTPQPTSALPYGLSSEQMATLSSLDQVGDYPLYVMHYYDDYDPQISGLRPAGTQAPAGLAPSLPRSATGRIVSTVATLTGSLARRCSFSPIRPTAMPRSLWWTSPTLASMTKLSKPCCTYRLGTFAPCSRRPTGPLMA